MEGDLSDAIEEKARDGMFRQLRQNLARCRRVIMDQNMDLKTRERWTQLYNNTSQVLNQVLNDRQMRDWEKRLRAIEEYRKNPKGLSGLKLPPRNQRQKTLRKIIIPQNPTSNLGLGARPGGKTVPY
jgi:hypothetical protein